ncbi:MAG: DNA-processing protein DprA [Candidatus Brocadiia bacterium]
MDHQGSLALLKLSICEGVGTQCIHKLLEEFGSAEAVLSAPVSRLKEVDGIGDQLASRIRRGPNEERLEIELDLLERTHSRLLAITSEEYPEALRYLELGAPPLLRIRGEYREEDTLGLAIVGSRNCTHYGRKQARRFAMSLVGMGFTIVSGLARGIDSAAHRAALQAGGRTIALLGCGLGQLKSLDDPELALDVVENGVLLSELPMDAPPLARHFPPRNRLISGLSLGVLVVEAGQQSGSLITARKAGEQGKDVFALPGPVSSPTSHGCHQLIRDGVTLVEDPRELAEELGSLTQPLELPGTPPDDEDANESRRTLSQARALTLNDRETEIYEMLDESPVHIEEVIERTGLAASVVSSTLLTLEIRGLVQQYPGQNYAQV